MSNDKKGNKYIKMFVIGLCLLLTGCGTIGLAQEATFESAYENVPEEEPVDIFISEGRGVVQSIDAEAGEVTMYLLNRSEERTFIYDGATAVKDKFGSSLSMQQLVPGEIADIYYNDEMGKLGSVLLVRDSWNYDGVTRFQLDDKTGSVSIGSDTYSMNSGVKVFSDGKMIALDQILKQDVISLRGIGHEVVSIVVEKGHGYIDLTGDEALIGGWIEVGQTVIAQITEDMLIAVPEGSYSVRITAGELDETKDVVIERDKETVLDFSHVEIPQPTSGRVIFEITPEDANVYIDDKEIDASYVVILPLGIHKITAAAEGYDTFSEYFEVKEETTTVRMTLSEAEVITVSGNASSEKGEYTITVETPEEAGVYFDNLYKGLAPVTFDKEPGDHVITLRKNGYVTRSHSIYIEDADGDLVYSFSELDPVSEENKEAGSTVSGNESLGSDTQTKSNENGNSTVSGNTSGESSSTHTVSDNNASVSGNN